MPKYFRVAKRINGEIYSTRLNDYRLSPEFYKSASFWRIHEWVREYEVDDKGDLELILETREGITKEISDKLKEN